MNLKDRGHHMNFVRVSQDATLAVAEFANKEGITIADATERLILTGVSRRTSLRKWRVKEARRRRT